jgi:hypothetical protein
VVSNDTRDGKTMWLSLRRTASTTKSGEDEQGKSVG